MTILNADLLTANNGDTLETVRGVLDTNAVAQINILRQRNVVHISDYRSLGAEPAITKGSTVPIDAMTDLGGLDNSPAINQALADIALIHPGRTLQIGAGVWPCSSKLIGLPRTVIRGEGQAQTVLFANAGLNDHLLSFTQPTTSDPWMEGGGLFDLCLDANWSAQTAGGAFDALHWEQPVSGAETNALGGQDPQWTFNNLRIRRAQRHGVFMQGGGDNFMSQIHIFQCGVHGLHIENMFDSHFDHMIVSATGENAYYLSVGTHLDFIDCNGYFTGTNANLTISQTSDAAKRQQGAAWYIDKLKYCAFVDCQGEDTLGDAAYWINCENMIGTIKGHNLGTVGRDFTYAVGSCTASIAGTVMTVTAVGAGTVLDVNNVIKATGVTAGTTIASKGTGTGGTGTYNVSASQTVASKSMTVLNSPALLGVYAHEFGNGDVISSNLDGLIHSNGASNSRAGHYVRALGYFTHNSADQFFSRCSLDLKTGHSDSAAGNPFLEDTTNVTPNLWIGEFEFDDVTFPVEFSQFLAKVNGKRSAAFHSRLRGDGYGKLINGFDYASRFATTTQNALTLNSVAWSSGNLVVYTFSASVPAAVHVSHSLFVPGAADPALNGTFKISSKSGSTITVTNTAISSNAHDASGLSVACTAPGPSQFTTEAGVPGEVNELHAVTITGANTVTVSLHAAANTNAVVFDASDQKASIRWRDDSTWEILQPTRAKRWDDPVGASFTGHYGTHIASLPATKASFTASIAGTTMTVTGTPTGALSVGDAISATGITGGTVISSLGTGTGGAGTYTVNNSQTLTSRAMTATGDNTATLKAALETGHDVAVEVVRQAGSSGHLQLTVPDLDGGSSTLALAPGRYIFHYDLYSWNGSTPKYVQVQ